MLRTVSEVIGYRLVGDDGEVGSISRFFFEDDRWVIRHVVVDIGRWISGRLVLISPAAVEGIDNNERQVRLRLTREQIRTSPDIDTDKPVSRQEEIALHAHYGYGPYWGGAGLWGAGFQPHALLAPPPLAVFQSSSSHAGADEPGDPHLRSTKEVIGYHLHTDDGETGRVDDIVFDDDSWTIRYLVIDLRRWPDGRRILMPAEWVRGIDWTRGQVSTDGNAERLHNAVEYRPGELAVVPRHGDSRVHHVGEIIGKVAVTTTGGERLGTVADVLIDTAAPRVIGLVIGNGVLATEHVLPLDDVERIGRDTVLVRTSRHLMNPREWRTSKRDALRCRAIRGRSVLTSDGREIGRLSDLLVEEGTGALSGIEVDERSLGGLRHRLYVVAASPPPQIGPDAIVLPS